MKTRVQKAFSTIQRVSVPYAFIVLMVLSPFFLDTVTRQSLWAVFPSSASFSSSTNNLSIVGQIGGPTQSVVVHGNYAYVGIGLRLVVIDLSNPSQPAEVAMTAPLASDVEGITISNGIAYVADGVGGLYLVDISHPTNPNIISKCTTTGYAEKVAVSGRFAYLADGPSGLRVIDVSDPTHPREVGSAYILDYAFDVAVAGNYVYVAAGGAGLLVADVSAPTHPSEISSLDTPGYSYGIAVLDSTAFIADGWAGLHIADVSNPAQPYTLGSTPTEGWAMRVIVSDNRAYVADEFAGLTVLDVSNTTNPTQIFGEGPHEKGGRGMGQAVDLALIRNAVCLADRTLGLRIIDISRLPSGVMQIGLFSEFGYAGEIGVSGNYGYVVGVTAGDAPLKVVNLTNPYYPSVISYTYNSPIRFAENYRGIEVKGNIAYLLSPNAIMIFDISTPSAPALLSTVDVYSPTARMNICDGIAYVTTEYDWEMVNVTNPAAPAFLGTLHDFTGGLGRANQTLVPGSVTASDGVAYGTCDGILYSINVSDPTRTSIISAYELSGFIRAWSSFITGNFLYLIGPAGDIMVIDISKPNQPKEVSRLQIPGEGCGVAIYGTSLYIAAGGQGLQIIDITDPANPVLTESIALHGRALGVAVESGTVYVGCGEEGLFVVGAPNHAATGFSSGQFNANYNVAALQSFAEEPLTIVESQTGILAGGIAASSQTIATGGRTTWIVNSTADSSSPVTLRWALEHAQTGDKIVFDPAVFQPTNPATIMPKTAFPLISQGSIMISAVGAGVILNGTDMPSRSNGLVITSDHNVIMGLQVVDFPSVGIGIANGSYNVIGGNHTIGEGNVISGNVIAGISIVENIQALSTDIPFNNIRGVSDFNRILGNYIGTDFTGERTLGVQGIGIWLDKASHTTIGGMSPGYKNVIAGNVRAGISILWGHDNKVVGNYIGTDAAGEAVLGNRGTGITIEGGPRNAIRNNVISGNSAGITIGDAGAEGNVVAGNLIGTDVTGTKVLGNYDGIVVFESFNLIGGVSPSDRNVISGNTNDGISFVQWPIATGNIVIGNYIGSDITGTKVLQSSQKGIRLDFGSYHNFIGGIASGEGNLIVGGSVGVTITGFANYNSITGNYVGTGIDGNMMSQNYWGIAVKDSEHNFIQANMVSGSDSTGIQIFGVASYNWVRANNVSQSTFGISVSGNGNVITLNSFNNFINGYDGGQANQWNWAGRGNYWSDYMGTEMGDGVGGIPYSINPNGIDYYPLVKPNGGFVDVWLTLKTNVPNVPLSINGNQFNTDVHGNLLAKLSYFSNYNITLPQYVQISSNIRLKFESFNGGNQSSQSMRLYQNRTLQATYRTQFFVSILSTYDNTSRSGWYDEGSTVTLFQSIMQIDNNTRDVFAGWTGAGGDTASMTIRVNAPLNLTESWTRQYYLMVVSQFGTASGSDWYNQGSNASISIKETVVVVNSTLMMVFKGWTGAVNSSSTSVNVLMDAPKVVTTVWTATTLTPPPSPTPTSTLAPTLSPTPTAPSTANPTPTPTAPINSPTTGMTTPTSTIGTTSSAGNGSHEYAFYIIGGVVVVIVVMALLTILRRKK
ncbi:MAG: hypothetical protein NWE95_12825 [Candidatus Bathyarchaeota archaeon]|nr:hypothetical protein [Candidatus Bathyarchaeota archaeon]